MQTIALIGNGTYFNCSRLLQQYDVIIALDGGANHCQRLGITPQHSLGDGDSITQPTADFQIIPDQTTTDLQKGIQFAQQHYPHCIIDAFCVTSHDRLDHTMAALLHPDISTVYTPHQKITQVTTELHLSTTPGNQVSVVNIAGCQWSGAQIRLDADHSGLSNRSTTEQVTITLQSGAVLVITEQLWT
ncbi:MAG: thiamine diphosphokinase [Candidatus Kerfeldbacteria bacterium]|nr:thiamine diphosphokinase [Candidatus Kerfeldbacteria bacterium]